MHPWHVRVIATPDRCRPEAFEAQGVYCRLALLHGAAEGFLVLSHSRMIAGETIKLRVARFVEQYWASWGHAAQVRRLGEPLSAMRSASRAGQSAGRASKRLLGHTS